MSPVREKMQEVLRRVFDDDEIVVRDDMTATDIEGWDSLQHINVIVATERAFGIRFLTAEISRLKEPGQNIGQFLKLVESKVQSSQ